MLPHFYQNQKKRNKQAGRTAINILVFTLILIIGLAYLWQVNSLLSQSYKLRNQQKKLETLTEANRKMKLEIAQRQSLPELQEAVKDFNLVKADDASYLDKFGAMIVAKQ